MSLTSIHSQYSQQAVRNVSSPMASEEAGVSSVDGELVRAAAGRLGARRRASVRLSCWPPWPDI